MSVAAFSTQFGLFLAIGGLTIYVALIFVRRSPSPPFPPGPRPDPLIGNILQMGSRDLKLLFKQWGKEYGEDDLG